MPLSFVDIRRMLCAANSCVDDLFIGDVADKSTWVVTFKADAAQADKDAAAAFLATIDVTAPVPVICILSQDLMAQFTADDAAKIQAAVTANPQFWLLWSSLQAQSDPMEVGNVRFLAGWSALVAVLGADRMTAIGSALGIAVT